MSYINLITATALFGTVALAAPASAAAQSHQRGHGDSGRSAVVTRSDHAVVGRAVPRTGPPPRIISPRVIAIAPYRPYYYRPTFRSGFGYYSYPYGYRYEYPAYGYGYPYSYGYYAVPPPGYLSVVPGR